MYNISLLNAAEVFCLRTRLPGHEDFGQRSSWVEKTRNVSLKNDGKNRKKHMKTPQKRSQKPNGLSWFIIMVYHAHVMIILSSVALPRYQKLQFDTG